MKLFKSLLVAPAALGLLAPMSVTANEINLTDVSSYSSNSEVESISDFDAAKELAVTNSRVDGLEARFNNFEAGSFSETTTASFSADFELSSEDGGAEAVSAFYGFQIDLNTSFTGEDSLDISIDAGNSDGSEFDLNVSGGGDDVLAVDGVSYTFPVGPVTAFVGDNTDGSALFSTACVYGGPSNTLDDCGNPNAALGSGTGTAAGASFEFSDGFAVAVGYTGAGSSTDGLMTTESEDQIGGQLSYAGDSFGASLTLAQIEDYSHAVDRNFWAINGYWTPEETGLIPSISVGYEAGDAKGMADTSAWFIGVQWDEAGPGTAGAAIGTQGASRDIKNVDEELLMYEAFYSYAVNDGMTITPLVYVKETLAGSDDKTGVMVKTSFSF